jgi:hypothetical protein
MVGYVHVSADQLPPGKTALLLFMQEDQLCAGEIERRYDGRLQRRLPQEPKTNDLVPTIARLMSPFDENAELFVVIEEPAYWPEFFPKLNII